MHTAFSYDVLPPTDFSHQWIDLAQNIFELTFVFLTVLIGIWDIAIPVGIGVTIRPRGGELDTITFSNRPWYDTPLWFNYNHFCNEFGMYWILFVSVHVACALFAFPSYAFQLFAKKKEEIYIKYVVFLS